MRRVTSWRAAWPNVLVVCQVAWLHLALLANPSQATQFPPRNQCTDIPGHVRCFTENGGLIHGAEVTTPNFTVTCRAFRRFWLQRFAAVETREVIVAGVCEQRDRAGNLMRRWDTVPTAPNSNIRRSLWASTTASLPSAVVDVEQVFGNVYTIFTGYYLPEGWNGLSGFSDPSVPAGYDDFPRGGPIQAWTEAPARDLSVESPRFAQPPACHPAYVVCSAYLKILHPDPSSPEVIVEMVSARRFFSFTPGQLKLFEHQATFRRQQF